MRFLQTPYLPQSAVTVAICAMKIENIRTIEPPVIAALAPSVARHADLGFCPLGANRAVCPPETFEYYKKRLTPLGFEIICGEKSVGSHYPDDCAYNVAIIGRRALCRVDITDRVLLSQLAAQGFEIINIAQGYAKCSICPIDEDFCISADSGAAKRVNTLLIENDGVFLRGFSNGFFGGATGMIDKKTLFVTGDIRKIASGQKIEDALTRRGVSIRTVRGKVRDIGSIIPIMQGE